jgi:hypothetical protein
MISIEKRVFAFVELGRILLDLGKGFKTCDQRNKAIQKSYLRMDDLVKNLAHYNAWFDEANVRRMMFSLGESLREEKLEKWLGMYKPTIDEKKASKTVAVIMAGNIPAVGFHDLLSVLITGNKLLVKLSTDDNKLIVAMTELLIQIEPDFDEYIQYTTEPLKSFDAIVATGSNNTSRYFDYYFSQYPHIIRKNRNGIAVIKGGESEAALELLASDIMDYYGLGCRNVSKIFVPENYDFMNLLDVIAKRKEVTENHKYFNNYEYNKAIFLVNGKQHYDTGNLLITEETAIASPISVLHFEYYSNVDDLKKMIESESEKIQCVLTNADDIKNNVPFGKSQQPELWDYADGVDTLDFLLNL